MFYEDFDAHSDEYDTARELCEELISGAENVAYLHADGGKKEGNDTDGDDCEENLTHTVEIDGHTNARRECVDAGGDRHGKHNAEG